MSDVTNVTNEAQLNAAIQAFDAGSTSLTIDLTGTITETTDLYAINNVTPGVTLVIDGQGGTLDGARQYRGLLVYAGNVTIENLTIADAAAVGGVGGAGLGGALFVASAGTVALSGVAFSHDSGTGGAGGAG